MEAIAIGEQRHELQSKPSAESWFSKGLLRDAEILCTILHSCLMTSDYMWGKKNWVYIQLISNFGQKKGAMYWDYVIFCYPSDYDIS